MKLNFTATIKLLVNLGYLYLMKLAIRVIYVEISFSKNTKKKKNGDRLIPLCQFTELGPAPWLNMVQFAHESQLRSWQMKSKNLILIPEHAVAWVDIIGITKWKSEIYLFLLWKEIFLCLIYIMKFHQPSYFRSYLYVTFVCTYVNVPNYKQKVR